MFPRQLAFSTLITCGLLGGCQSADAPADDQTSNLGAQAQGTRRIAASNDMVCMTFEDGTGNCWARAAVRQSHAADSYRDTSKSFDFPEFFRSVGAKSIKKMGVERRTVCVVTEADELRCHGPDKSFGDIRKVKVRDFNLSFDTLMYLEKETGTIVSDHVLWWGNKSDVVGVDKLDSAYPTAAKLGTVQQTAVLVRTDGKITFVPTLLAGSGILTTSEFPTSPEALANARSLPLSHDNWNVCTWITQPTNGFEPGAYCFGGHSAIPSANDVPSAGRTWRPDLHGIALGEIADIFPGKLRPLPKAVEYQEICYLLKGKTTRCFHEQGDEIATLARTNVELNPDHYYGIIKTSDGKLACFREDEACPLPERLSETIFGKVWPAVSRSPDHMEKYWREVLGVQLSKPNIPAGRVTGSNICGRSGPLLRALGDVDCSAVGEKQLEDIDLLNISVDRGETLKPGDFAGFKNLRTLGIDNGGMKSLPKHLLDGPRDPKSLAFVYMTNGSLLSFDANVFRKSGTERVHVQGNSLEEILPAPGNLSEVFWDAIAPTEEAVCASIYNNTDPDALKLGRGDAAPPYSMFSKCREGW